jgi:bifunctional non-homologous end joining protein LigD
VAQALEKHHPKSVTSTMAKSARPGKVFIDWSQNSRHKTTVAAYSLRARPLPTVSTPVSWDEVTGAAASGDLTFQAGEVLERVATDGDLFAATLDLEQQLPKATG